MAFDVSAVARDFDKAAEQYDRHAALQHAVLKRLAGFAVPLRQPQACLLDAGCGTGRLADIMSGQQVMGLDISPAMCRAASLRGERAVTGDILRLPFAGNVFDGVVCCLALQWVENPLAALREFHRVVMPDGHVALASFGTETLQELHHAFAAIGRPSPVSLFAPMEALVDRAQAAGFCVEGTWRDVTQENYAHPLEVMHRLKAIGAVNKRLDRARGLLTPKRLRRVCDAYPKNDGDQGVTASWDVYYILLKKVPL